MNGLKGFSISLAVVILLFAIVAQAALPCCCQSEGENSAGQALSAQSGEMPPCHETQAPDTDAPIAVCDDCGCVHLVNMHPQPDSPLLSPDGLNSRAAGFTPSLGSGEPFGLDRPPRFSS